MVKALGSSSRYRNDLGVISLDCSGAGGGGGVLCQTVWTTHLTM